MIARLPKDGPADLAGVQGGDRVGEVDGLFVNVERVLLCFILKSNHSELGNLRSGSRLALAF